MWVFNTRAKSHALQKQRERTYIQTATLRRELVGELQVKKDKIAELENRLDSAPELAQDLDAKNNLLANEQQRYADLKDRYLSDVGRARILLKTRGDASAELERRNQEADEQYKELHTRWESERKHYAALVTEKNQKITELESQVEGLDITNTQEDDASLHSYSHGQLESMLVGLRQQVAEREAELLEVQQQLAQESEC